MSRTASRWRWILPLVVLAHDLRLQAAELGVDEVEHALLLRAQLHEVGVVARAGPRDLFAEQLGEHLVGIPLGRDLGAGARVDHVGVGRAFAREAAGPEAVLHRELQRREGGLLGRRPAVGDIWSMVMAVPLLVDGADAPGARVEAVEQSFVIAGAEGVALEAVEEDHVRLVRQERLARWRRRRRGRLKSVSAPEGPLHGPVLGRVHAVGGEQQHQPLRSLGPGCRPAVQRRDEGAAAAVTPSALSSERREVACRL